jgi:hypothetical protein
LAERGEFELPVPICEHSDDGNQMHVSIQQECHKHTNAGVLSIDLQIRGLMVTTTMESATVKSAAVEFAAVESVTVEPIMESAEAFAAESAIAEV